MIEDLHKDKEYEDCKATMEIPWQSYADWKLKHPDSPMRPFRSWVD